MHVRCAAVGIALLLAASSPWAHHSTVAFDVSKTVNVRGKLARVDWRNPHIELSLEVGGADQVEIWTIESAAPSFFRGRGVSRSVFESAIGQTVSADVYRAKDGRLSGSLVRLTFANGTTVAGAAGA